jgi:hypothetical protein
MQPVTNDYPGDAWHAMAVVVRGAGQSPRIIEALTIENRSRETCVVAQIRGLTTPDGCEE